MKNVAMVFPCYEMVFCADFFYVFCALEHGSSVRVGPWSEAMMDTGSRQVTEIVPNRPAHMNLHRSHICISSGGGGDSCALLSSEAPGLWHCGEQVC